MANISGKIKPKKQKLILLKSVLITVKIVVKHVEIRLVKQRRFIENIMNYLQSIKSYFLSLVNLGILLVVDIHLVLLLFRYGAQAKIIVQFLLMTGFIVFCWLPYCRSSKRKSLDKMANFEEI